MNVLSLCSGIAGLELGVSLAVPGSRVICWVERDAYCQSVLNARMRDGVLGAAPIWDDLTAFDGNPWRGLVDCVTAGIPCQPWSVAGKRKGVEDERWIWADIYRIVQEVEPRWFFVEEVPGFARGGLGLVLRDLAEIGFRYTYDIFSAADVGAPHLRKRLFLLARKGDGLDNAVLGRYGGSQEALRAGGNPAVVAGNDSALADTPEQSEREPEYEAMPLSWERSRKDAGGRGSGVGQAHTGSKRLEGDGEAGAAAGAVGRGSGAAVDGRIPVFPPGPADLDGWKALLEIDPSLEPAICHAADRTAARVGGRRKSPRVAQLRALGNAVVPQTAALAWTVLWRRMNDTDA